MQSQIPNLQNLNLRGPTDAGKSGNACAFAQLACPQGFSVFQGRVAWVFEERKIARGDGSATRQYGPIRAGARRSAALNLDEGRGKI